MDFPLVTRAHHDEVVELLQARVCELISEREQLQRALRRLHDKGFIDQWGFQLYDSLPKSEVPAEPIEPELTEAQQSELDAAREHQADKRRLASIARTKPSQLGAEMERQMVKDAANRANAAHPAREVFSAARAIAIGRTGKA